MDDAATGTQRSRGGLSALREVLVIVVSILIAFVLDAWWDERSDRLAEDQLLSSLLEELTINREMLRESVGVSTTSLAAANTLLAMTGPEASLDDPRVVDSLVNASMPISSFDPSTGTLTQILQLDGLRLIRDESLRRELAAWDEQLRDFREDETRAVQETFRDLLPVVRTRIPTYGLEGRHPAWASAGPPEVRQALLRDVEFANVIGEKVYRLEVLIDEGEDLGALIERMIDILRRGR